MLVVSCKIMFTWDTIGNQKIIDFLQNSIVNNKLSHAYLFLGSQYLGKKDLANEFSQSILCYNYHQLNGEELEKYPCNQCVHCLQFKKQIHPDVYILKREANEKTKKLKKNISIDQVRQVQEKLNKKSFLNLKKIAIIQEAEYLSEAASNSCLKTLEEPKNDTILILLSSRSDFMLDTIISRCQVFTLKPTSKQTIYDYLVAKGALRDAAKEISNLSLGKPIVAKKNYNQIEILEARYTLIKIFLNFFNSSIYKNFAIIDEIVANYDQNKIVFCLDVWQTVLRDMFLIKLSLENQITNEKFLQQMKLLANNYDINKIKLLLDKISLTKTFFEQNVNSSLALENLVLEITN